jgi:hypothetical protein
MGLEMGMKKICMGDSSYSCPVYFKLEYLNRGYLLCTTQLSRSMKARFSRYFMVGVDAFRRGMDV